MRSDRHWIQHRRTERFALLGLRCALAVVLAVLGCGLWFTDWAIEPTGPAGLGPDIARIVGSAQLAGGAILLIPPLAEAGAFVLALSIASAAVSLRGAGALIPPDGLAFLTLMAMAFLLLGAALRLRHRDDAAAWHQVLARYAGREDRRRLQGA